LLEELVVNLKIGNSHAHLPEFHDSFDLQDRSASVSSLRSSFSMICKVSSTGRLVKRASYFNNDMGIFRMIHTFQYYYMLVLFSVLNGSV
jgi:hypothetical protein